MTPKWTTQQWQLIRERVETLFGVRGDRSDHAVRFRDLDLYDERLSHAVVRGAAEADGLETPSGAAASRPGALPGAGSAIMSAIASGQALAQAVGATAALVTELLVVGSASNRLTNTRFRQGLINWQYTVPAGSVADESSMSLRLPPATWSGGQYPTLMIDQTGSSTGDDVLVTHHELVDTAGGMQPGAPVVPNRWIEVSAHVSAHRCRAQIEAVFYDASGTLLATSAHDTNSTVDDVPGPSDAPLQWTQIWAKMQAPVNSAFASLRIRKKPTNSGDANSQVFVYGVQLAHSAADKTQPSAFSPDGTSIIDGGQIIADSITAASGAIADATITTAKIADLQVDTIKIAENAVSTFEWSQGAPPASIPSSTSIQTLVVTHARTQPAIIFFKTGTGNWTGGTGTPFFRVLDETNNRIIGERPANEAFGLANVFTVVDTDATAGETITYQLEIRRNGATGVTMDTSVPVFLGILNSIK